MTGAGQERLRLREPGHGRLRAVRGGGALRVPRRLRGGRRLLDRSAPRPSPCARSCGRSSGSASCPCWSWPKALTIVSNEFLGADAVPEGRGRGRHLLHDLRPGRPGHRHGRASTRASTPRTSPRSRARTAASPSWWPRSSSSWWRSRSSPGRRSSTCGTRRAGCPFPRARFVPMALSFAAAAALAIATCRIAMARGIRALETLGD